MSDIPAQIKQTGNKKAVAGRKPAVVNRFSRRAPSSTFLKWPLRLWPCVIGAVFCCALVCVSFWPVVVGATSGDLDTTFGQGGLSPIDFSTTSRALATVLQADGKIVVAGNEGFSNDLANFALARLNNDGSLDPTFGSGGRVTTDISSKNDKAYGVALQADGKILAAGITNTSSGGWENGYFSGTDQADFALVRYNTDGSLDNTFGTAGIVRTDFFGFFDAIYSITVLPDQKILVAGEAGTASGLHAAFALARYDTDGSLDPAFGSGGRVTTLFSNNGDIAFAVTVQPDHKIVAAGCTFMGNSSTRLDFAVARYNPDGSLDASFGSGGQFSKNLDVTNNPHDVAHAVALQADGKIVVGGQSNIDFALIRLNTDGTLDSAFGQAGVVRTDFNGREDRLSGLVIQPDGRIIAFGSNTIFEPINPGQWLLARYKPDGSLDNTFGQSGKVITFVGHGGWGAIFVTGGAVLQPDGKLIAVGETFVHNTASAPAAFGVIRYLTTGDAIPTPTPTPTPTPSPTPVIGALDPTFGTNGKVILDFGGTNGDSVGYAVALQPNGKIIVAGAAGGPGFAGGLDFAVGRLNSDGSRDNTFGAAGFVTVDIAGTSDRAAAVALQWDGKIVVAGVANEDSQDQSTDFVLVRLKPDGSLDQSFGNNGKVRTDFGNADTAFGLAVQSDQKLVVVGKTGDLDGTSLALVRYNRDGSLDSTFGAGGKVVTAFNRYAVANAIVLQPDGKIVVAGQTIYDFALVRYNKDGSLDSTFGNGGKVTRAVNGSAEAKAVALQWDGKIVLAGNSIQYQTIVFALLRYNADGSPDVDFGVDGVVTTTVDGMHMAAQSVVIQPDHRIVAVGRGETQDSGVPDWVLVRYDPDGSIESSFGVNGVVTTYMGVKAAAFAAVVQLDGKIVAVGEAFDGVFAVLRYIGDPSLRLLTEENSNRAVAFDSVTLMRDPFPVSTTQNFSSDHHTRVSFFAVNLALNPGENASAVTAQAEDSQNGIHPLTVEFVGDAPNLYGVTQVTVRLSDDLTDAGDVWVSIRLHGIASNKALISIKPQ